MTPELHWEKLRCPQDLKCWRVD